MRHFYGCNLQKIDQTTSVFCRVEESEVKYPTLAFQNFRLLNIKGNETWPLK